MTQTDQQVSKKIIVTVLLNVGFISPAVVVKTGMEAASPFVLKWAGEGNIIRILPPTKPL